jgi:hypothetical protein
VSRNGRYTMNRVSPGLAARPSEVSSVCSMHRADVADVVRPSRRDEADVPGLQAADVLLVVGRDDPELALALDRVVDLPMGRVPVRLPERSRLEHQISRRDLVVLQDREVVRSAAVIDPPVRTTCGVVRASGNR